MPICFIARVTIKSFVIPRTIMRFVIVEQMQMVNKREKKFFFLQREVSSFQLQRREGNNDIIFIIARLYEIKSF